MVLDTTDLTTTRQRRLHQRPRQRWSQGPLERLGAMWDQSAKPRARASIRNPIAATDGADRVERGWDLRVHSPQGTSTTPLRTVPRQSVLTPINRNAQLSNKFHTVRSKGP